MDIGDIGIWTSYRPFGIERVGEAAKLVEQLGYGAWWVGGSPHVPDIRPVLEATSTLVAATGILNVWSNNPGETAAADAALRADFPRFMLGVGIGHPEATSDYRRPLRTMRVFLDGLDASPTPPPADERCLAALGPKMLDLAGERTAGTHSYFTTVDHTRFARERLGSGKLVAPELACVVDTDPVRAKAVARDYAKLYLGLRNYTKNLLNFGFTERGLADGGSDDPPQVLDRARQRFDRLIWIRLPLRGEAVAYVGVLSGAFKTIRSWPSALSRVIVTSRF